ncbi:MAG: Rrf2 family transcriptional regulator [Dongiaceae bacterium]
MKLGTKGRYAVMAMADLANQAGSDPVPLAGIAARQEIPVAYLEQLFAKLSRCQLVKSHRGPGGGVSLGKRPADITIAAIVAAVGEEVRATRCNGEADHGCRGDKTRCATHDLWADLGEHIHSYLSSITLYDVVQGRLSAGACVKVAEIAEAVA